MTNKDIRKVLSLTENSMLFLLEQFDEQAIGENVCAFLNSKGGFVVSPLPNDYSLKTIKETLYDYLVPQATMMKRRGLRSLLLLSMIGNIIQKRVLGSKTPNKIFLSENYSH